MHTEPEVPPSADAAAPSGPTHVGLRGGLEALSVRVNASGPVGMAPLSILLEGPARGLLAWCSAGQDESAWLGETRGRLNDAETRKQNALAVVVAMDAWGRQDR